MNQIPKKLQSQKHQEHTLPSDIWYIYTYIISIRWWNVIEHFAHCHCRTPRIVNTFVELPIEAELPRVEVSTCLDESTQGFYRNSLLQSIPVYSPPFPLWLFLALSCSSVFPSISISLSLCMFPYRYLTVADVIFVPPTPTSRTTVLFVFMFYCNPDVLQTW